jgi:hypothetical protein
VIALVQILAHFPTTKDLQCLPQPSICCHALSVFQQTSGSVCGILLLGYAFFRLAYSHTLAPAFTAVDVDFNVDVITTFSRLNLHCPRTKTSQSGAFVLAATETDFCLLKCLVVL